MMAAGKNKNPPTAAINNPKDYSGLVTIAFHEHGNRDREDKVCKPICRSVKDA